MKKLIILLTALMLVSCGPVGMTNEEIVKTTKYCKDNGMDTEEFFSGWNGVTTRIQCTPITK